MTTYSSRKKELFHFYQEIENRLHDCGQYVNQSIANHALQQAKLIQYLFLNLVHIVRNSDDIIRYGTPQYSSAETGFTMVLYRIAHEGYDYCVYGFHVLGCRNIHRECGPTISVQFDSSEEKEAFRAKLMNVLEEAEGQLNLLGDRTPQESYILKTNPVIVDTYSTQNEHIVVLNAIISDAVDFLAWKEILKPWADNDRIRDYYEITVHPDKPSEIKLIFYRIRKRDKFLRYMSKLSKNDSEQLSKKANDISTIETAYFERIFTGDIEYAKEFKELETPMDCQMKYMSKQMEKTLYALADCTIPNTTDYTYEELKNYCESLVAGQMNERTIIKHGSWPLTSDIARMPLDERVKFVFFPSYIAVATLSQIVLRFPDMALKTSRFIQVLRRGLYFCNHHKLRGHGNTAIKDMLKALEILCIGGVPKILNEYPDISDHRLRILLEEIEATMIEDLKNGSMQSGTFGKDYSEDYKSVLRILDESRMASPITNNIEACTHI